MLTATFTGKRTPNFSLANFGSVKAGARRSISDGVCVCLAARFREFLTIIIIIIFITNVVFIIIIIVIMIIIVK